VSHKKIVSSFLFLVLLIAIDQVTKVVLASRDFSIGPLKVFLVKNYGLPFGINSGNSLSLIVVLLSLGFLGYYYATQKDWQKYYALPLNLILVGAVSNIADRLTLGYVRDMFDLRLGFVFNVADAFIILGLLTLFIKSLHKDKQISE
jgi:signal peptidase II